MRGFTMYIINNNDTAIYPARLGYVTWNGLYVRSGGFFYIHLYKNDIQNPLQLYRYYVL